MNIENSKDKHLFEMEYFCKKKIFTFTFDKINASLLHKSINLFTKNIYILLTLKFGTVVSEYIYIDKC